MSARERGLMLDTFDVSDPATIQLWNDHGLLHLLSTGREGQQVHLILSPVNQRKLRKFMEDQA